MFLNGSGTALSAAPERLSAAPERLLVALERLLGIVTFFFITLFQTRCTCIAVHNRSNISGFSFICDSEAAAIYSSL